MEKIIFARAPVRICDVGGWTDTWFCKSGSVFNFCIDLYSYVRIYPQNGNTIEIVSENLDLSTEIQDFRKIEYDGVLDLLKASIKRLGINQGLKVYARSDAPPGCGTGTSASIAVAMIGGLSVLQGHYYVRHEIAELAHALETEELSLQSGVQDQYAAAYGGFNYMEIDYPNVRISRINVKPELAWQLEQQMILVYLGSRSSSKMHEKVIENYEKGDATTTDAFTVLQECPRSMVQAVYKSDIHTIGEIMNRNWEAQKQLHEEISTPEITGLENIAQAHDAIGFKVNGAGGGGSAVILSATGKEYNLRKELVESGYQILPFKFNFTGLQVWQQ
ncbi:MAG TPA: hypothetical protein VKM55_12940 [Candidatus Lokiarchaeia archaeon]|nr:hypothetical protein [Candidatus Lokiarchaeia archaeon]